MRILHIVGSIDPAAGGPTEAIRMLIRHAPEGYTAELATLNNPAEPFLADLPFPVHALGTARKSWYSPKLLPWLRDNRHRFDGVIVHGLWEYTGLAARRAFAGHLPYVVFPHGMLDPWFKRTFPNKHRKKWLYWIAAEYWVLRGAHRVLFTTALERDLAAKSFWLQRWQSMVVALGTEPPPADRDTLLRAFAERCPELSGRRFLLFLGRIHPKKGCDLLTRAFAQVAASDPELHLVMAGPDPNGWQRTLEAELTANGVADRVLWPGMLRGEAKWGAFAASEAFILPSHQENFGIAAVEALASAKPILLAHPVNIAPDVERAGCALVEDDTLDGTRRLLQRWFDTSLAEREAMGQSAFTTFQRLYDMRRNTEAILRVFQTTSEETLFKETPSGELAAGDTASTSSGSLQAEPLPSEPR